jgi:glycosyltransferase involved in cell wall biosynthesis
MSNTLVSNTLASLSPLHRLWRLLPVRQRRVLAARGNALLAPRPDALPPPGRSGVVLVGEVERPSGLGEAARVMRQALARLGVDVTTLDVGVPFAPAPAGERGGAVPDGAPLLLHVNAPLVPWALRRLPRALVRGRRVVGCWAWELPVVPESWRVGLPFVHEIWAPSSFTANALRPLADGRPVRVVPHPLAVVPPLPSALDRAAFGLPADAVLVLVSFSLASSFERKNPLAAVAAFRAAFGDRKDRLLLLKIGEVDDYPTDFDRVLAAVVGALNVRIETRTLPAADSHALTACADIVLSLHRSEGFGLVPAEAMLLGRAVVATGWSGNMDYMDAASAALVAPRLVAARDPRHVFEAAGAVWADPDPEEAAGHLRRLAGDPEARRALGARGRARALRHLGAGKLIEAVAGLGLATAGECVP